MNDRADLLDALFADPSMAAAVPRDEAVALLAQMAAVQASLLARIVVATMAPDVELHGDTRNDMLSAAEAAKRTGMSVRWLYVHAKDLPFARRVSARAVRFSARGLEKWLAARKA
jgi:predicted DNA-binding transcriptional regulator AlpA